MKQLLPKYTIMLGLLGLAIHFMRTADHSFERLRSRAPSSEHPQNAFFELIEFNSGRIPFPLSQLVSAHKPDEKITIGTVSSSRSLQRNSVTTEQPRIIFSFFEKNRELPRIFFGYSEKAQQLEVIAWNSFSKKYDFLLVADYVEGKTARVIFPNRTTCTRCHQNEGPIFSEFPWMETSFGEGRGEIHLPYVQKIAGVDRATFSRGGFFFDGAVRSAFLTLQLVDMCKDLCGEDLNCRSLVLMNSMMAKLSPYPTTQFYKKIYNEFADQFTARAPKEMYSRPSSILPDRDPQLDPKRGGAGPQTLSYSEMPQRQFGSRENIPTLRSPWRGIQGPLDPQTKRPSVSALEFRKGIPSTGDVVGRTLTNLAEACFDLPLFVPAFGTPRYQTEYLPALQGLNPELLSRHPLFQQAIVNWPPNSELATKILVDTFGIQPLDRQTPQVSGNGLSYTLASEMLPANIDPAQPQSLFVKHCSECHSQENSGLGMGYVLPLESLVLLKAYNTKRDGIISRYLESLKMPPSDASQILTSPERHQMIKVLKE